MLTCYHTDGKFGSGVFVVSAKFLVPIHVFMCGDPVPNHKLKICNIKMSISEYASVLFNFGLPFCLVINSLSLQKF